MRRESSIVRIGGAVLISALGMAIHTVREFGYAGILDPATGMLPVVGAQVLIFLAYWLRPAAREAAATALLFTGFFQLVGGAIISVLPLPILPFQPEQSVGHYVSHVVLGIAQLPLIFLLMRRRSRFGTLDQVGASGGVNFRR